jgi:hypothetical protein
MLTCALRWIPRRDGTGHPTCLVGEPSGAARQWGRMGLGAGLPGGLSSGWGVAVAAGKAAPAGRRWQTGFGPALSGAAGSGLTR